METSTSIVGLEQRPVIRNDFIVPDFIASFKPPCSIENMTDRSFKEYKCLVEVKSTEKEYFDIGGSRLKRLRNYANFLNLPLLFAVRFTKFKNYGWWNIIEDDRKKSTLKIKPLQQFGCSHVLWDEYWLELKSGISIEYYYSKSSKIESSLSFEYGKLIDMSISDGRKTLKLNYKDGVPFHMLGALLECYGLRTVAVEKLGDLTIEKFTVAINYLPLSSILLYMNKLPNSKGKNHFDALRIIATLDANNSVKTLTKKDVILSAKPLFDCHLAFAKEVGGDNEFRHLDHWKRLGSIT